MFSNSHGLENHYLRNPDRAHFIVLRLRKATQGFAY